MIYDRIVIKVGTSTITGGTKKMDKARLIDLVRQLSWIEDHGTKAVLVSSGAIATGRELMDYPHFSKHIPGKQMLAAIGQPYLMSVFSDIFQMYNHTAAQILMTRDDFMERRKYLNARNTLEGLLDQNVIPIINENDTLAIEEIKVGDNDTLSAYVAGLIGADLLVLVTDQDGLFTANPESDASAKLISMVDSSEIPESIWEAAGGSISGLGTGGMVTKVKAADIARRMGTPTMIVNGSIPDILIRITSGESFGTFFKSIGTVLESRKRFLLSGFKPNGPSIEADAGAVKAILSGKSLLPAGIIHVSGTFDRSDTVRILDSEHHEIGTGMINYSSEDVQKIMGCKASEIEEKLGCTYGDEVIHRDFMIIDRES